MVCFGRQDVGPSQAGELGAGSWEEEAGGGMAGAGLSPQGSRVTLKDALLATERCETEKDAVGGGSGLEPGPGPADGVYRSQAAQHRQQTSDGTNERTKQPTSQRPGQPEEPTGLGVGVDVEKHGTRIFPSASCGGMGSEKRPLVGHAQASRHGPIRDGGGQLD